MVADDPPSTLMAVEQAWPSLRLLLVATAPDTPVNEIPATESPMNSFVVIVIRCAPATALTP